MVTKTTLSSNKISEVRKQLKAIYKAQVCKNELLSYEFPTDISREYGYGVAMRFKDTVLQETCDNFLEQLVNIFKNVEFVNNVTVETNNAPYQIRIIVTY